MDIQYLSVAQLGARMHYAVPRILWRAGRLHRFYTDGIASPGLRTIASLLPRRLTPGVLRRYLGRELLNVPRSHTECFGRFGLEYAWRRGRARDATEQTRTYLWAGKEFCRLILRRGVAGCHAFYTFNSAGLELLRECRRMGIRGIVEQTIAPREVESRLLAVERESFPEWDSYGTDLATQDYVLRERSEWDEADVILCGSEFVRNEIASCGGPAWKCAIVPYGVTMTVHTGERAHRTGPLRILTVGEVGLRKGSPYVMRAAKELGEHAVFRMIGRCQLEESAMAALQQVVEILGIVPRREMTSHYQWADVFLLPSICEGSATATYEALAAGLPVICTSNTGSVVRHEIDGFIVPIRDSRSIAERILELASDRERLRAMSYSAKQRMNEFTEEVYGRRLLNMLEERLRFEPSMTAAESPRS